VAHSRHDVPEDTLYEVPHEIHDSVKFRQDMLNHHEHEEGATHISEELRKNQMLHDNEGMPDRRLDHPKSQLHHIRKRLAMLLQIAHKRYKRTTGVSDNDQADGHDGDQPGKTPTGEIFNTSLTH